MTAGPMPASGSHDGDVHDAGVSLFRDVRSQIAAIDRSVYTAVAATATPVLDRAVTRLSNAANYSALWFGIAGAMALVGGRRGRRAARDGIASIALASAVSNQVLKRFAARARPDRAGAEVIERRWVRMPGSTSFPSGHSASAFAFATSVSAGLPALAPLLHTLAALVAYSRVHTGVHYPGDVVVGALVGAVAGHGVTWVLARTPA